MGTVISDMDSSKFAATAMIKKEGATITGTLLGVREVKTKYGPKPIFSLKVEDAACTFTRGDEEVEPAAGESVDIFAPTRLAIQLGKVQTGQRVSIAYKGIAKGGKAHTFKVEVL